MRMPLVEMVVFVLFSLISSPLSAGNCDHSRFSLGVSRTIIVDTTGGAKFGTLQYKEKLGLQDGEVVLTFDDGPHPQYTRQILATLGAFCTKATFFFVGERAEAYPDVIKEVAEEGHTVGAHTWNHANLSKKDLATAEKQIEHGFNLVAKAVGGPIAPFFRYPGLNHAEEVDHYLATRNIAIFSVDIISGDTRTFRSKTILRNSLRRLKKKGKGIFLFHDLKRGTARMLPAFLKELKKQNYKIVHLVAKRSVTLQKPPLHKAPEKITTAAKPLSPSRFSRKSKTVTAPGG